MKLAQQQWRRKRLQVLLIWYKAETNECWWLPPVNNHHRQSATSTNFRGSTAPPPRKLGEQPLTLLPLFRRPWICYENELNRPTFNRFVRFCGQPHYCYRPYYPTARLRSPSSYMVSDEVFPDRLSPCRANLHRPKWVSPSHPPWL